MWGKSWKELERRVKDVEVLLKEFADVMVLDGRKVYGRLNKLENKVDTLGLKERRITTLEQQVNDLMNENVDLISHLRVIEKKLTPKEKELKIYRDEERGGYVLKEKELEPRIGDLVVYKTNPTIIRTVTNMSVDHIKLENGNFQRLYSGSDWIQRFQMDWKLLVKKEDFK